MQQTYDSDNSNDDEDGTGGKPSSGGGGCGKIKPKGSRSERRAAKRQKT